MKISELVEALQSVQKDVGDISVISSVDSEGNGYNEVRGVDFIYHGDDYVFDTLKEADEFGFGFKDLIPRALVYV